jgi:hypothetical protein
LVSFPLRFVIMKNPQIPQKIRIPRSLASLTSLTSLTSLGLFAIAWLTGCASFERGVPQEVVILSYPSEASVYINGEAAGITPLETELPRKLTHEIRLEKEGYNPAVKYVSPVPNEKSDNLIRFGLSRDLGYYVDLEPGTVKAKMKSELVPESTGADPFERMAQRALEADRKLEAGEITPAEHKYIIEQIIEFFEEKT